MQRQAIGFGAEQVEQFGGDEREGHGFVEAGGAEQVSERLGNLVAVGGQCECQRNPIVFGDPIVAPDPGDFFDEVDFSGQVSSPTGHFERGRLIGVLIGQVDVSESELDEDIDDVGLRDIDAEDSGHLIEADRDASGFCWKRITGLDHVIEQFATGQFEDQLTAASAGGIEAMGIDAAFEAERRVAEQ